MSRGPVNVTAMGATVVSIVAVGLSAVTAYLTYVYERMEVFGAAVEASAASRFTDDDGAVSQLTHFAALTVLVSNTGTRPVTFTGARLVTQPVAGAARPESDSITPDQEVEPRVIPPGASHVFAFTFQDVEFPPDPRPLSRFAPRHEHLALELDLYGERSRLQTPLLPICDVHTTFQPQTDDQWERRLMVACDLWAGPTRLA